MEIGKEMYKLFKWRYYIKVDNVTTYYYDKYYFVKKVFELIDLENIEITDEFELINTFNKIL